MPRPDSRSPASLRPIQFELGVQREVAGSVLVRWGHTHVLCAATFEERVPPHRIGKGGWLTAEYAMLPGSSKDRLRRERPSVGGRTAEIQRLVGRALRATFDLGALGARTLWVDCDVIQADGGTRCASVTAGYVAAALAVRREGLRVPPPVAAVSVGLLRDETLVDLCYVEDSAADVDLNYVATPTGLVEVQGTAENRPFPRSRLDEMLNLGDAACQEIFALQRAVLGMPGL